MLLIISRCAGVFLRKTLKPNVLSLTECHSFQGVIQQIGERRGDAVVVLSADDDERIGRTDPRGQPFEDLGRLALLVFLVHFLQQGELILQRVDQRRLVPAGHASLDEKSRRLDALAVRADGPVDDEEIECFGHGPYPFAKTDSKLPWDKIPILSSNVLKQ